MVNLKRFCLSLLLGIQTHVLDPPPLNAKNIFQSINAIRDPKEIVLCKHLLNVYSHQLDIFYNVPHH